MKNNNEKKITGTDFGILLLILGMIASIILIVFRFINHESKTIGVVLLCACSACLSAIVANKKRDK